MAVSLVDIQTEISLGSSGDGTGGIKLDVAAAGNSEVVKAKLKVMTNLGIKGHIEDILITLDTQPHLIRPLTKEKRLFVYLVVSKAHANLAMPRHKLAALETKLVV